MDQHSTARTVPTGERPSRPRRFLPGLAALLAAVALVPALALAGGPRGGGSGGPDAGMLGGGFGGPGFFSGAAEGDGEGLHRHLPLRRLAFFLDLTEQQITDAQAILEAAHTAVEPLRTARRDLAMQLREALDAAEPDPTAVGELVLALHDNQEQIRAIHQGALDDFEALLTPEQLERFEVLRDARRVFGRHHGPHGPGAGRPGPGGGEPPAPGGAI